MLRIGVMEGVLKQPREQLFTTARDLGFDGVEIEVRGDTEALGQWAAAAGVQISSVICGGEGAGHPDAARRSEAKERLRVALRAAVDLGVAGILWPMFELTSLDEPGAVERFVEDATEGAAAAEAHGVVVAWENALNAADTRVILERVGSLFFRCYFDFANAAKRGADPVAELRALRGLIYQVHAKNTNKQHLDAPGVNLAACLTELQRQGYPGWIVLETPSANDPLESARHNLRVLQETWDDVAAQT
jgi:sugar phosphate isomerase/epimerase